jgi:hypothetical protein
MCGKLEKIQRLVCEGASIHELDGLGRNALMLAVAYNKASVVHWALEEGGPEHAFLMLT